MSRHLAVGCVDGSGEVTTLRATLSYDPQDPWAVTAAFHDVPDEVRWTFGRDLLLEGLRRPVGEGDVRVAPSRDARGLPAVALTLVSPDGAATLLTPPDDLGAFLAAATAAVPRGREGEHLDVDAAIAACGVLR